MLDLFFELLGISQTNTRRRPNSKTGKKRSPASPQKNRARRTSASSYSSRRKPTQKQYDSHKKQQVPGKPHRKSSGSASYKGSGGKSLTAYHGTSDISVVKSIRQNGWQVGSGNLHGDGIYLSTSYDEAKSYAGSSGVVIKCRVSPGKTATWNNGLDKQYQKWCRSQNILPDSSAKTAFLIKRGFKTLRTGTILVVLYPQYNNQTAWREKAPEIKVCSVHNPVSKKRIHA
jgi:hypothetical protein